MAALATLFGNIPTLGTAQGGMSMLTTMTGTIITTISIGERHGTE